MRAVLSIVIPTLNAAGDLPGCLGALMEGVEAGVVRELIISDGGSVDATCAIADEVGAVVQHGVPSRGGQIQRGVRQARGDWILVLHADTQVAPGWSEEVLTHISRHPDRAGYFRLRFARTGPAARIVAGWANLRAGMLGLPFGDQGLLISRALHDQVGGYCDIALMEDMDIARRLGRRRLRALPAIARTSAQRYETQGWIRRGARNLALQIRFLCGADPERLAQRYRRSGHRS